MVGTIKGTTLFSVVIGVEHIPTELGLLNVEVLRFNELLIRDPHLSWILSAINQPGSSKLRIRIGRLILPVLLHSLEIVLLLHLVLEA